MRIGIDLGGTKIETLALDDEGTELGRYRSATPRGDYDGTIRAILEHVALVESETGLRGSVGIGIPGAESKATGLIKNANSVWLIGKPLAADLAAGLERPVRLANDANCFALSEATDGAAAGANTAFGVILGTGVGGGCVVGGHILAGVNAISGEWGHNPLPWPSDDERPGPPCYCGLEGCIETFLSGPGFARDYDQDGNAEPSEIADRAAAGEPAAQAALARYCDRLARALATVINIFDPDVIVLGGGMSNVAALYDQVPSLWGAYVFSDRVDTSLRPAKYGDASGVRGAAWLWPQDR
ncbi:MAG: ROK family protein [Alphaproteobacteria bacterium]